MTSGSVLVGIIIIITIITM